MDLLNLCLTSTYFQYSGKHYKQLHGHGVAGSVVVAEILTQNIEERALATCRRTIPLWLRYVDDTFTAEIDDFHKYLFTVRRHPVDHRDWRKWKTSISRLSGKPREQRTTNHSAQKTDKLLDESSYNPTSHKATTTKT